MLKQIKCDYLEQSQRGDVHLLRCVHSRCICRGALRNQNKVYLSDQVFQLQQVLRFFITIQQLFRILLHVMYNGLSVFIFQ